MEDPVDDTETSAVADFAELAVPEFELRPSNNKLNFEHNFQKL